MLIVVAGMPGAGSSTVIQHALKLLRESGEGFASASSPASASASAGAVGFKHLNYGDVMFEIALQEGIVKSRDEIRKLPQAKQQEIQRKACDRIAALSKKENIILDTHCTVKTPFGYLPGLPAESLQKLAPRLFVLIEAFPHEIARRRSSDRTRERDVEDERSIEEHQAMNRAISMAYACLTGAPVKIIENHDGALEKATTEFAELLTRISQNSV